MTLKHRHDGFRFIGSQVGKIHNDADIDAFRNAPIVLDRHMQLRMAMAMAPDTGFVLEFGVFKGGTVRSLALQAPSRHVFGFDSFEGLPEAWERSSDSVYKAGHFALDRLPLVPPNVTLIKGFFDQTLDNWLAENPGPVALVHIDCDLYGGTKHVMSALTERLAEGAIIVFDELCDWQESGVYPNWPEGEWRAFCEWIEDSGFSYRILSRGKDFQAAIQVLRAPQVDANQETCKQVCTLAEVGGRAIAAQLANQSFNDEAPFLPAAYAAIQWNAISKPALALEQIKKAWGKEGDGVNPIELYHHRARARFKLDMPEQADKDIRVFLGKNPADAVGLALGGSISRRLRDYKRARVLFTRAHTVSGIPAHKAAAEDLARLEQIRPEFFGMKFSGLLIQHLVDTCDFETVLDIGSGSGEQSIVLRQHGKRVTELDYGDSVYFRDRRDENVEALIGDFVTMDVPGTYDCVIASHVLEHQENVGLFLRKIHSVLREGGVLGISVPPFKHNLVGGHLTVWNAGLVLYNLVLAGFDCKNAWVRKYGHNISVAVQKRTIEPQGLEYDKGDVDRILQYLPDGFKEGCDGDIVSLN